MEFNTTRGVRELYVMKKVSIIIPVYNKNDYIERCFNSIVTQSYKNIEVIVINDGSNDNSKAIIENYISNYTNFQFYNFYENSGVAKTRNFGLSKATGEYIYFLDADDFLAPYAIEIFINNIGNYNIIAGSISKRNTKVPSDLESLNVKVTKLTKAKKTKALRGRTTVNIMFKTEFVKKHDFKFDENVTFFSDISFSVPAIVKVKTLLMIKDIPTYIKGECFDPIEQPSLSLMEEEYKIEDFFHIYNTLKTSHGKYISISNYLDKQLLNFYFKSIKKNKDKQFDNINVWFNKLSLLMQKVNVDIINKRSTLEKIEIKKIIQHKKKSALRMAKLSYFYKTWKKGFSSKQEFYKQVYVSFFTKLPIKKDTVIFESFAGKSYSDSPRYIYEELQKNHPNYKCIWIFNDKNKEIFGNGKIIKRNSLAYYYYLAISKYWVVNARMPNFIIKRPETVYLQTWHGTPLKRLASDMKEVHMPGTTTEKYKRNFYNESQKWDYLVSPNEYSTKIFSRAFKFNREFLEFGYPRNDVLYLDKKDKKIKKIEIKEKLGIPDKKVVLYAPTWRDDEFHEKGKYKFNLKLDLKKMQESLGEDYVVVLRMHYLIAENMDISEFNTFAYDLSSYEDIAELYLISDILITDYSSVFFDYANLRKPILFFTYDIDKYRDTLRGFYMDFENEAPGPLLRTSDEVIEAIKRIASIQNKYKKRSNAFYIKYCKYDNGKASKNIIEKVFT